MESSDEKGQQRCGRDAQLLPLLCFNLPGMSKWHVGQPCPTKSGERQSELSVYIHCVELRAGWLLARPPSTAASLCSSLTPLQSPPSSGTKTGQIAYYTVSASQYSVVKRRGATAYLIRSYIVGHCVMPCHPLTRFPIIHPMVTTLLRFPEQTRPRKLDQSV